MQTVTADAINSRNKQKHAVVKYKQIDQENSRKQRGRKTYCSQKCKQTQLMQQIENKDDNIGRTRTKSRKNQTSIINTVFRKAPVKQKGKYITDTIEQGFSSRLSPWTT